MLTRPVDDRAHAFGDRLILLEDAGDPGEAVLALRLAIDEVVVVPVLHEAELAEPVRRVGEEVEAARSLHSATPDPRAWYGHAPEHHVLVVDRHPGADEDLRAEDARRDHREEREEEVGDAPVIRVRLRGSVGAVGRAELGIDDLVLRRAVGHEVVIEAARRRVLGADGSEVQEAQVARVDVALEGLEPVALAQHLGDDALAVRQHVRLDVRQRGRHRPRPQVGPDDAVALDARVRCRLDLRPKAVLRRFVRHVDTDALAVELPTVVHAAKAFLLVSTEEEGGAAVRTRVLDQSHLPRRDAKSDQVLAEQADSDGRTVRPRQLTGRENGNPVLPDEVSHRRAWSHATEQLVVFAGEHRTPPLRRPQRNAGMTSRAKSSIERSTRACSTSPNQKLQLKWVIPTSSWMRSS